MDLEERLSAEHSKSLTTAIVNYIGDDKKRFKALMGIFLKGEYRLTQRAAWPLSYVAIAHPKLVAPYMGQLIKKLTEPGNHPAIARNILRTFLDIEIPEKYHGVLIDVCFKFIISESYPAAIRAFAIGTATKICIQYPELKNELLLVINELSQLPQPPAIKSRTRAALKILK